MRPLILSAVLVPLFCVSVFAQETQNKGFIGVFQECDVHCSTYRINSDLTFWHKFNGQETKGTWKYIGKNKIKLFAKDKKAERVIIPIKNENGEVINGELKIPKTPAFKRTFIFQNDSICTINRKNQPEFCIKRVDSNLNQLLTKPETSDFNQNYLPKDFAGIYQRCLVLCETIKINQDYTFEYLFESREPKVKFSSYYRGILKGNWTLVERNKINFKARDEERIKEYKKTAKADGIIIEPAYPTEIDYEFIFKKKNLCMLLNGGIYACYKKLNKPESENLFFEEK